jgi:hypothetical protein
MIRKPIHKYGVEGNNVVISEEHLDTFNLKDPIQKLEVLQSQFFPFFEEMLEEAIIRIEQIYGDNVSETYAVGRTPQNRKQAQIPKEINAIAVGLAGHRTNGKNHLSIKDAEGRFIKCHPSRLDFVLVPEKNNLLICVTLIAHYLGKNLTTYNKTLFQEVTNNRDLIPEAFPDEAIYAIREGKTFPLSFSFDFPLTQSGCQEMIEYFVCFYSFLSLCTDIALGKPLRFREQLLQYQNYDSELETIEFRLNSYTQDQQGLRSTICTCHTWLHRALRACEESNPAKATQEMLKVLHKLVSRTDLSLSKGIGDYDISTLQTLIDRCHKWIHRAGMAFRATEYEKAQNELSKILMNL